MKNLAEDIRKKEFKNIYLLYGEEAYLKNQYRKLLRDAILPEGDTVNLTIYEGKNISVRELIDQAETMPFFADRRLILVENSGFFKSASPELADYLEEMPESAVIVFVEDEVDKRGRLYKTVKSKGLPVEFGEQTEEKIIQWILRTLKKENKNITKATMELFLEKTGTDMNTVSSELEKVLSYTYGREVITREDVEEVCTTRTTNRIFEMIDAIAEKKQKKAMDLYYDLLALKEPPMRILFLITRQINLLLQVKELQELGYPREKIAEKMKLQSFIVRKCMQQSGAFSGEQLRGTLETAVSFEEAVKTGRLEDKMAVELIIVRMSR